jgi:hypothetical protein
MKRREGLTEISPVFCFAVSSAMQRLLIQRETHSRGMQIKMCMESVTTQALRSFCSIRTVQCTTRHAQYKLKISTANTRTKHAVGTAPGQFYPA